ncbi:MAG: hypothetical protein CMM02_17715 [Rhodopirellula sp.]|nr:hypothetical protein [Rhodopirellula sp.]
MNEFHPRTADLPYNKIMKTNNIKSCEPELADTNTAPPPTKLWRTKGFRWSFIIFSLITGILLLINHSGRMIDVNREILSLAKENWEVAQIEDYLVEISVNASGKDVYEVTVVDNKPVLVKLNGKDLHRRHAFDTWTITGMLDTIAIDIEHCERWEAGRAAPGTCDLIIKATFDQEKGIPLKYIRMELGRPSNVGVMDWEITRFEPTR